MLTIVLLANIFLANVIGNEGNGVDSKSHTAFPVPFELPNRNDRADQCWLRIEDIELTETLTIYCYIAHEFLRNYIHDYNTKKLREDDAEVSLWSEVPRTQEEYVSPKFLNKNKTTIKDWKMTTVVDPITHMRLYVTQKADCRLIMYSREGMSNYKVECERILYFINDRISNRAVFPRGQQAVLVCVNIFLIFNRFL